MHPRKSADKDNSVFTYESMGGQSYLDDDVRHAIPYVGGCSWVALLHAHRKLHVRLLGGVAFAVGALSQRLGDDE